jgi:hypothetical protein
MSALLPTTEEDRTSWDVSDVQGDITPSVDHLVGGHKQCVGHGETKCLRRLEIEWPAEFGRLED